MVLFAGLSQQVNLDYCYKIFDMGSLKTNWISHAPNSCSPIHHIAKALIRLTSLWDSQDNDLSVRRSGTTRLRRVQPGKVAQTDSFAKYLRDTGYLNHIYMPLTAWHLQVQSAREKCTIARAGFARFKLGSKHNRSISASCLITEFGNKPAS